MNKKIKITAIQEPAIRYITTDGHKADSPTLISPSVASIYDSDKEIMKKIRETKCHQCKIAWKRLKENNLMAYQMLNS